MDLLIAIGVGITLLVAILLLASIFATRRLNNDILTKLTRIERVLFDLHRAVNAVRRNSDSHQLFEERKTSTDAAVKGVSTSVMVEPNQDEHTSVVGLSRGDLRQHHVVEEDPDFLVSSGAEVTAEGAQRLYNQWCTGTRPEYPWLEIVPITYEGRAPGNELSQPIERFRDAAQIASFVRISGARADDAFMFPHPDARFDQNVHPLIFPGLSAAMFKDRTTFAKICPHRIFRVPSGEWEKR